MTAPRIGTTQPSAALLGLDHLLRIKRDQLQFYQEMRATHGDVVRLRLGPYRTHLLFHPDHIEALLTRKWASFIRFRKLTDVVRQWNGDSRAPSQGDAVVPDQASAGLWCDGCGSSQTTVRAACR